MIETPKINNSILTRGLPKTGQTSVYVAGDDGTYQAGWWRKRLNANNRPRFITKIISGNNIIIDRATGLWWADSDLASINNYGATGSWSDAMGGPIYPSYGGKSDWRIPNVLEIISIINFDTAYPATYTPFNFFYADFWTSNTSADQTLYAFMVEIQIPQISLVHKGVKQANTFRCRGGI